MKKKLISLSFKQILLIVLPLAVVASFTCFSFTNIISDIITADTTRYIASQGDKVEYEVRLAFEPPIFALNTVAENVSRHSARSDINSVLKATASQYPQCAAFYFGTARAMSNGGYQMTSDDWEAPKGFEHTERPWFTGAVSASGEVFSGEPYMNSRNGKMCISFSRAIYDSDDTLIGVAGCDLVLDKLSEILSDLYISPNTKTYIVDQKGLYLTNEISSAIMTRSYFDDAEFDTRVHNATTMLENISLNAMDGIGEGFVEKGIFYTWRKIANAPWFIIMQGPTSDFTGSFSFWMKVIAAIVTALILGCVVLNAYLQEKTNRREAKVGEQLITEVQTLVVAAKENAATSQDQSAAVKEIVATMTDNNALSENISKKITDVSSVAQKTSSDVSDGVSYLAENVQKLREIADANTQTIEGIKALGGKIENIWDIVTLINSVADQAKIIAFNAELEASSAGEAGKNFHIVATEIRRLADGIIDGTKEIKERITEIQQSSDRLVLASESGTEKINEGVAGAASLSERFESIKNASEVTATSASDITTIIQQQSTASEQILITLKQIAAGVENFTAATENISTTSQNLKSIAEGLNTRSEEQS
ncbi:MAG: hypothetical protein IJ558_10965 [Treponema sp.]|nr:hypothetical protein [Treponema sp.]